MQRYQIRDLLAMDPEHIWNKLRGPFIVVCDDGEIQTNRKETWFSTFAWRIFKEYPLNQYLLKHHFAYHFKSKLFKPNTHFPLLEACGFDAFDEHKANLPIEKLAKIIFDILIDICNEITVRFGKHLSSLDIFSLIDLADHPLVKEIKNKIEPNEVSINEGIKAFNKLVMDANGPIGHLVICRMAQAKLIKLEQLSQACLLRGYAQDVDSSVFPKPIMRSFVEGIRQMDDFIAESRGAAVAVEMASNPLQMATFSSRKMNFISEIITTLHRGDCGSQHCMRLTIRDKLVDDVGTVIRSSDLDVWNGVHYHEGDYQYKTINSNDKHLIGKTVYARTVLGCQHPDPYGVCEVCLGKIADTCFESTNVGSNSSTTFTKDMLQLLLSAKHYLSSADVEKIILDHHGSLFFTTDSTMTNYILKDTLPEGTCLLLSPTEATNLTDVDIEGIDIQSLDKSRISQIREVGFEFDDGRVDSVSIGLKRRPAMMTHELLEYAKEQRWTFDSRGNFRIRLDNWDFSQNAFALPLRNYNIADHTKDLSEFIEARAEQIRERDANISPYEFLLELSDLVNKRSVISISILQIIVKGLTIVSAEDRNYNIPKPNERMGIGVLNPLMNYRSISALLDYMGHRSALKDPANFVLKDRPDHPMDVMIMPHEVIEVHKYYKT